jgi:hypothetical protein
MINKIANPIHRGEVTHHQDQSIKLVNFNTKKIKNNTDPKLIPLEDLLLIYFNFM